LRPIAVSEAAPIPRQQVELAYRLALGSPPGEGSGKGGCSGVGSHQNKLVDLHSRFLSTRGWAGTRFLYVIRCRRKSLPVRRRPIVLFERWRFHSWVPLPEPFSWLLNFRPYGPCWGRNSAVPACRCAPPWRGGHGRPALQLLACTPRAKASGNPRCTERAASSPTNGTPFEPREPRTPYLVARRRLLRSPLSGTVNPV